METQLRKDLKSRVIEPLEVRIVPYNGRNKAEKMGLL